MTPETRQTMLFSATMPAAIVALARTHMRHPMNIRAESSYENATVPATAQFIYQAHDLDKPEIIGRILQAEDADKMIVFTRTKRQAQRIAEDLAERGFKASPLHGDMAQVAREKALTKFREDKMKVLVATDVAARGIDVSGVSHVVNYTCPEDDKTYIHRIGRTGRAGASGIAITLVDATDVHRWKMINKALDLPFDEPTETYSTSEHLFHDQGIPPGTKGRIVPPAPVERKPREERDRPPRTQNRDRNRTRTRSGQAGRGAAGEKATSGVASESASGSERASGRQRQPQPASSPEPLGRVRRRYPARRDHRGLTPAHGPSVEEHPEAGAGVVPGDQPVDEPARPAEAEGGVDGGVQVVASTARGTPRRTAPGRRRGTVRCRPSPRRRRDPRRSRPPGRPTG